MRFSLEVALRYLGSKKRAFISIGTVFAILGVALGVAALATVRSVTGGFEEVFRDKVLGVNAHVLVLKYSTDFREYRTIMEQMRAVPGVKGIAPFSINPMMLTHGKSTATGVLLKGVDPALSLGVNSPGTVPVLALPSQIKEGKLDELRAPDAKPAERRITGSLEMPLDLDAGAPAVPDEIDDAGRNVTFLREVKRDIEERERREANAAASGTASAAPTAIASNAPTASAAATESPTAIASNAPAASAAVKEDARTGAVAASADAGADLDAGAATDPDGGSKSALPDDDDLPDEYDADECRDKAKVALMPGIVIGVSLAKNLDLKLGDCVTVTSPTIGFSFSGGSLRPPVAKRFRVIATFEAGFDQYDSKLVYTDLYQAQAFYDQGDTVTGIEMVVDDIDDAGDIAKQMEGMLPNGLYHTMDWEELNHGLFTALKIQKELMSFVLGLIILVASFTVVATLIMVVLDKKKEVAVMKAMGASDGAILQVFLFQGTIIGFVGTVIGLALGIAVCKGLLVYGFPLDPKVYFVSHLPVQFRPGAFVFAGLGAMAICMVATIIPSLYAARLVPAEGFRGQ